MLDSKRGQITKKRQSKQKQGQATHSKRQRVEETATADPQLNVDHHEGSHVLLSHTHQQEQAKAATEIVRWWDSFESVDPVEAADEVHPVVASVSTPFLFQIYSDHALVPAHRLMRTCRSPTGSSGRRVAKGGLQPGMPLTWTALLLRWGRWHLRS